MPFDISNFPNHAPPHDYPTAPVNLRHYRRRRGLSLRQMASEIGVSGTCLRRTEAGYAPLPASQLKIAQAYGLDVVVQWPDPADDARTEDWARALRSRLRPTDDEQPA